MISNRRDKLNSSPRGSLELAGSRGPSPDRVWFYICHSMKSQQDVSVSGSAVQHH